MTELPAVTVARLHVTVPPETEQPAGTVPVSVIPVGSGSVTTTPAASSGPWLVTVSA